MAYRAHVEFGNLIVTAAGERNLLDLWDPFVRFAFGGSLTRSIGETTYRFHDTAVIDLGTTGSPLVCVVGRFVKDTVLQRHQIYDRDRDDIIRDESSIATAPSALFTLILNNHKLLYLHETPGAPSMHLLATTLGGFIREVRDRHLRLLHDENQDLRKDDPTVKRLTWAALRESYPPVNVRVIPLGSQPSLHAFLERFEVLASVSIQMGTTNAELDNSDYIRAIREKKKRMNARSAQLVYRNPAGLSKTEAEDELAEAIKEGNTQIVLKGTDVAGDKVSGNNEEFKVKVPVEEVPGSPVEAARLMMPIFEAHLKQDIISVGETYGDPSERIQEIAARLRASG